MNSNSNEFLKKNLRNVYGFRGQAVLNGEIGWFSLWCRYPKAEVHTCFVPIHVYRRNVDLSNKNSAIWGKYQIKYSGFSEFSIVRITTNQEQVINFKKRYVNEGQYINDFITFELYRNKELLGVVTIPERFGIIKGAITDINRSIISGSKLLSFNIMQRKIGVFDDFFGTFTMGNTTYKQDYGKILSLVNKGRPLFFHFQNVIDLYHFEHDDHPLVTFFVRPNPTPDKYDRAVDVVNLYSLLVSIPNKLAISFLSKEIDRIKNECDSNYAKENIQKILDYLPNYLIDSPELVKK